MTVSSVNIFFSKISSDQFSVIISFMELMEKYILSTNTVPKIIKDFLQQNKAKINKKIK